MESMNLEETVISQRNEIEHLKRKIDIVTRILDGVLIWNEKLIDTLAEKVKMDNDKKADVKELTNNLKSVLGRIENGR